MAFPEHAIFHEPSEVFAPEHKTGGPPHGPARPETPLTNSLSSKTNQEFPLATGEDSIDEPFYPGSLDYLDDPLDPGYIGDAYHRLDLIANLKLDHLQREGKWPDNEEEQEKRVGEIFQETAQTLGLEWPRLLEGKL